MSSASGRHEPSQSASASTVVANNAAGYHDLKIDGYSSIKDGIPVGMPIKSSPFSVGGYRWRISFFPNGDSSGRAAMGCVSLILFLDEDVADPVTAQFEFSLMGHERVSFFGNRKRTEKKLWSSSATVTSFGSCIGCRSPELINNSTVGSYVTKQGSLTVRCDVVVFKEFLAEEPVTADTFVSVPPTFTGTSQTSCRPRRAPMWCSKSGGRRSPRTAACSRPDRQSSAPSSLAPWRATPLLMSCRYDMERLKLVCESKLCEYIDMGTAVTILTLAEQHRCNGLKKACFNFLGDPAKLRAVMASDGFKHLSRSCPSIKNDLMSMLEH
ncbi:unnamed protein product [Urochloa decumbens]|uniref:MATH domain-containing protein n=1 Tax=Urochloa decumbens TaxID=240449 RepID=A0ABC8WW84_9POAL